MPSCRPSDDRTGPNFYYTPPPEKSQSVNYTKNYVQIFPKLCNFLKKKFLTSGVGGGILSTEVKRGAPKGSKKILKKIEKPLDKLRKA